MSNYWTEHGETPPERERRRALCACLNAGVVYRGVLDGLCYFEVCFNEEEEDGAWVTLTLPAAGITGRLIAEYVDAVERQRYEEAAIPESPMLPS